MANIDSKLSPGENCKNNIFFVGLIFQAFSP